MPSASTSLVDDGHSIPFAKNVKRIANAGKALFTLLFSGIAAQRDADAKRVVDYYRQDRWSDSIERDVARMS